MTHSILLIITGSIAAFKSLELIRRLKERGDIVRVILSKGGEQFVTPLSISALAGDKVYQDLWSLTDEVTMGHIRLSREADIVVVAPASANFISRLAQGLADDLAGATLLASNKRCLIVPAMNTMMWAHPAVQRNLKQIVQDGVDVIPPDSGKLACGELGEGRMAEVSIILEAIDHQLKKTNLLQGVKALVTSGPTYEPIDPVRFIGNRSSGKQGHAIATALAKAGAEVTLVSGPTTLPDPFQVKTVHVNTAKEMLAACEEALPTDIAICAAAVADWYVPIVATQKLKKNQVDQFSLHCIRTPDILAKLANHSTLRPKLVIGFAAETENFIPNARKKLQQKNCDGILLNDVSKGKGFGCDENQMIYVTHQEEDHWPFMSKQAIAEKLVDKLSSMNFKTGKLLQNNA